MTTNGKKTLVALYRCEQEADGRKKFTAEEVVERFEDPPARRNPVMTISSYLTHVKRSDHVKREASSDKTIAWWELTPAGRKVAKKELEVLNAA
jgi:hypothetical protein